MRKHSTLFLIHLYIGSVESTQADEEWFCKLLTELERRGVITITDDGTKWHFEKLRKDKLELLAVDMGLKQETVGMFRDVLADYMNNR
jgi:hypothetical protein